MSEPRGSAPLSRRRVLVTRAPHQASELAERLRAAGAEPVLIPTITIAPPASFAALDAALACLATYDWMVFTSANAVEAFHRRAQFHRLTQMPKHIAAIGSATARAAEAVGLTVDIVPPTAIAESLAKVLVSNANGRTFLLVRAAEARDVIPDALRDAGGLVTIAEAYRNEVPAESARQLHALLSGAGQRPDAVTFTSASSARNLASLMQAADVKLPADVVRASIGPITSDALRELGMAPDVEAREPSIAALVEALAWRFSAAGG